MLTIEQVRELRENIKPYENVMVFNGHRLNDLLDTLEAALKVVEAGKQMNKCNLLEEFPRGRELKEALSPFTAKTGDEK